MNEVKLLNIGGIDQNVKDQYARDIIAPSENGLDSTSNLPVASRHYDVGEFLIGQDFQIRFLNFLSYLMFKSF